MEGYHKWMNHLLDYKDGYNFLPSFVGWEEKLAAGKGWAYGAEFIARKETGRITGWIGYGLMWSDRQFDEINIRELRGFGPHSCPSALTGRRLGLFHGA